MHITASVFINDDESGLHHDYDVWLEKLAPHEPVSQYRHNVGEDNADAHMKRQIMGREVVVAVTDGKLDFGPWEQIFYGEFDGKRKKRVAGQNHRGVTGRRPGRPHSSGHQSSFHHIWPALGQPWQSRQRILPSGRADRPRSA